jgi:hypothetical protein
MTALSPISEWTPRQTPPTSIPAETALHSINLAQPALMHPPLSPLNPVLFGATLDARLRLRKPFRVQIEKSEQGVAAYADEIGEFGYGVSIGDALHDLGKTIAELYFSLNADKDRLSADLEALRSRLDEYIEVRRPPGRADQR